MALSARATAALAGAAPVVALIIASRSPAIAIGFGTLAVLGTLHGLGRIVQRIGRDADPPLALVLGWGLAAWIAVAGPLLAVGWYGPHARWMIAAVGCVAGGAWMVREAPSRFTTIVRERPTLGQAAVAGLVIGLGALYVLAAAGRADAPFVDGELGMLDQLRRLEDTGALADPIGFPRVAGLGGHVTATALATLLGDLRTAHVVDRGVCFAIALGTIAPVVRSPRLQLAAIVVPILASSAPELVDDLAPSWLIISLLLTVLSTLGRAQHTSSRCLLLVAIGVAGALATVRHAGLVFAAVLAYAIIRQWPQPRPSTRVVVATLVAIIMPYAVSATLAWFTGPADLVLAGAVAPRAIWVVGWLVGGALLTHLVHVATRVDNPLELAAARPIRMVVIAAAAAVAAAGVTPSAVAIEMAIPFVATVAVILVAIAFAPALDDDHGAAIRDPLPPATAVLVIALTCAALTMGRYRSPARAIPMTWPTRLSELISDVQASDQIPVVTATGVARDHAAALAAVPDGARVGTWTDRGDLVPHDRIEVIDLRTGPAQRCNTRATVALTPRCEALIDRAAHLGLGYIVVAVSSASPGILARFASLGTVRAQYGDLVVIAVNG
ncbi:MAG: hypothetical protein AB7P03_10805 [Kofleriaceae bacterium]